MKNNKIVTITNKNMTRFMMSLDDSINLVLKLLKMEIMAIYLFKNHLHAQCILFINR